MYYVLAGLAGLGCGAVVVWYGRGAYLAGLIALLVLTAIAGIWNTVWEHKHRVATAVFGAYATFAAIAVAVGMGGMILRTPDDCCLFASTPSVRAAPLAQPALLPPPVTPALLQQDPVAPPATPVAGKPETLRRYPKSDCGTDANEVCYWFGTEENPHQYGPYQHAGSFSEGFALVKLDTGSWRFIDTQGKLHFGPYQYAWVRPCKARP